MAARRLYRSGSATCLSCTLASQYVFLFQSYFWLGAYLGLLEYMDFHQLCAQEVRGYSRNYTNDSRFFWFIVTT